jgi:hypothetical protein
MLGMVVRDVYTDAERRDLRASLKRLLPIGSTIWSLAGVYCFWDPETHDALYVGLSNNLAGRFDIIITHDDKISALYVFLNSPPI